MSDGCKCGWGERDGCALWVIAFMLYFIALGSCTA